jgi:predicted permease
MPEWKKQIRNRLASLRLEPGREAQIVEELSQHLEDRYRQLRAEGAGEGEAYQATLDELRDMHSFGAIQRMPKSDVAPLGSIDSGNLFSDAWRDLRYACRALRQSPAFTFFVVLTLALGIGANTTVFTVINTLILNPLPVSKPAQLVAISAVENKGSRPSTNFLPISYLNLKDLQAQNSALSSFAGYTFPLQATWMNGSTAERLFSELVTWNYFDTLGLQPAKGRFFTSEEDSTPGGHPVVVLNYGTWQARFGGASDIIGRTLRINNVVVTVIGVAPPGFIGVNAVFGPDMWLPSSMAAIAPEMRHALDDRAYAAFHGVARLKSGIGREQAQANLAMAASALEKEYPNINDGQNVVVQPIADVVFGNTAGTINRSRMVLASVVLLVIVGLVLLIACSNVTNLLLARAAARRQEIAVRLAIGASRARLIRQLLTESLLLGLLSGALGLAIAYEGCRALWSFRPADKVANLLDVKMDDTVFWYALLVSLVTGLVFGIVPAIRASQGDMVEALKEETRTAGRTRRSVSLGNALLVGQVAFSFIALVTAALFLRSMERAYEIDPGFETKKLALFMTAPGQAGYDQARTKEFYRQVRARVETLPGVASVSWASSLPLWGRVTSGLVIEGQEERKKTDTTTTVMNTVDFDYFATTGVPITRGRAFTEADQDGSVPVAVINETMAERYWPKADPVGKRLQVPGEKFYRQVAGVAKTANYQTLGEPPQPCVYVPLRQASTPG